MAAERSNGAPGGAPVRPIPPTGRPYPSIRATGMCTKALRRGKLIGVVLGDEFTIALGDMGQKQQKNSTCYAILLLNRDLRVQGGLS